MYTCRAYVFLIMTIESIMCDIRTIVVNSCIHFILLRRLYIKFNYNNMFAHFTMGQITCMSTEIGHFNIS